MTIRQMVHSIIKRWWLMLLVPVVALVASQLLMMMRPYESTVRATVLIPGDTEIPGDSERPELMVLDDLGPLIGSEAFAEGVASYLPADARITIGEIQASLSEDRYSRVVSVHVTGDDAEQVTEIANAVSAGFPELINQYLVPEGGDPATVTMIDQPSSPTKTRDSDRLRSASLIALGLLIGSAIALIAGHADLQKARSES